VPFREELGRVDVDREDRIATDRRPLELGRPEEHRVGLPQLP
jgi:hypothetical protein